MSEYVSVLVVDVSVRECILVVGVNLYVGGECECARVYFGGVHVDSEFTFVYVYVSARVYL